MFTPGKDTHPPTALLALLALSVNIGLPFLSEAQTVENAEQAVTRLKHLYFVQNYASGQTIGREYVDKFGDPRVQAWYLLNRAENGDRPSAAAEGEAMIAADADDIWGHFALAGALNDYHERDERIIGLAERALAMAPDNPDVLWLMANVLNEQGRKLDAVVFVDEHVDGVTEPGDLLLEKAFSLYYLPEEDQRDRDAEIERALDALHRAREVQPAYVPAYMWAGHFLNRSGRHEEALPLLRFAVRHGGWMRLGDEYVSLVQRLPALSRDEKEQEVKESVSEIFSLEGEELEVLSAMANWYNVIGLTHEEGVLDEKVLALAPDSREAEWVLTKRLRNYAQEHRKDLGPDGDPSVRRQLRRLLRDFVSRPSRHNERLHGEAYMVLFFQMSADSVVEEAPFLEVVKGMARFDKKNLHITYAAGARELAEKTSYYREAEELARQGLELVAVQMEENRDRYETVESFDEALGRQRGLMLDALGWVYFNEGRLDEAEEHLLDAFEVSRNDADLLFHLGRLYEARHSTAEMEEERLAALDVPEFYYVQGALVEVPDTNPNDEPLFNLYVKRHGTEAGFEEYRANLEDIDRWKRREKVLSDRISAPEAAPGFALKRLDGTPFESEELRGKVAVINYWGVWCGWCIKEAPELQELSQKYRDDPEVAVLTINNDPDPNRAREWMAEQDYEFEVLIDDGFVADSGIFAFPTTWFIDREGRIAFKKVGWTKALLEEFSWRIEALR